MKEGGRARNHRVDFTIFTRDSKPEIPEGSAVRAIYALTDTSFAINCNGIVKYETKELERPYRLIVDFPGIFDLSEQKVYEIQRGIVERARIGYHPDQKFTRVVFDLTRKGRYSTKAVDNTILVFIK
jgi:hypothetical protein